MGFVGGVRGFLLGLGSGWFLYHLASSDLANTTAQAQAQIDTAAQTLASFSSHPSSKQPEPSLMEGVPESRSLSDFQQSWNSFATRLASQQSDDGVLPLQEKVWAGARQVFASVRDLMSSSQQD
ncbi:hypothetical protein PTSG_04329 [Salpingoeca rosetta]|uniref:Altered inheritance of mitochondria protein 5, mitochondrial n=1 Tax=Salpingoeca rosetta (strain ATCC 50818 / BSB-021) TaxID=946362 RepID=F2U885_SALR5|nr:uncharacterized protein PTSG_04329 [Salpingoeca rosetta]EGD72593.1 hypothetical protein PTSG_04329 [Salpingoeca rosetta]|eukprot:XP_004994416.1 hypothetical protein PTSG_04329 [Salpingoeca rosetta]